MGDRDNHRSLPTGPKGRGRERYSPPPGRRSNWDTSRDRGGPERDFGRGRRPSRDDSRDRGRDRNGADWDPRSKKLGSEDSMGRPSYSRPPPGRGGMGGHEQPFKRHASITSQNIPTKPTSAFGKVSGGAQSLAEDVDPFDQFAEILAGRVALKLKVQTSEQILATRKSDLAKHMRKAPGMAGAAEVLKFSVQKGEKDLHDLDRHYRETASLQHKFLGDLMTAMFGKLSHSSSPQPPLQSSTTASATSAAMPPPADDELRSLASRVDTLTKTIADSNQATHNQMQNLESQLQSLSSEHESLKSNYAKLVDENQRISTEREAMKSEIESLRSKHGELGAAQKPLTADYQELGHMQRKLNEDLSQVQAAMKKLDMDHRKSVAESEDLRLRIATEEDRGQMTYKYLKDRVDEMAKVTKKLDSTCNDTGGRLSKLASAVNNIISVVSDLEAANKARAASASTTPVLPPNFMEIPKALRELDAKVNAHEERLRSLKPTQPSSDFAAFTGALSELNTKVNTHERRLHDLSSTHPSWGTQPTQPTNWAEITGALRELQDTVKIHNNKLGAFEPGEFDALFWELDSALPNIRTQISLLEQEDQNVNKRLSALEENRGSSSVDVNTIAEKVKAEIAPEISKSVQLSTNLKAAQDAMIQMVGNWVDDLRKRLDVVEGRPAPERQPSIGGNTPAGPTTAVMEVRALQSRHGESLQVLDARTNNLVRRADETAQLNMRLVVKLDAVEERADANQKETVELRNRLGAIEAQIKEVRVAADDAKNRIDGVARTVIRERAAPSSVAAGGPSAVRSAATDETIRQVIDRLQTLEKNHWKSQNQLEGLQQLYEVLYTQYNNINTQTLYEAVVKTMGFDFPNSAPTILQRHCIQIRDILNRLGASEEREAKRRRVVSQPPTGPPPVRTPPVSTTPSHSPALQGQNLRMSQPSNGGPMPSAFARAPQHAAGVPLPSNAGPSAHSAHVRVPQQLPGVPMLLNGGAAGPMPPHAGR